MSLSKFNQQWYDLGRAARIKAQVHAYQTKTAVHLPLSSHNATAASHWRDGWNSVSLEDIKKACLPNLRPEKTPTMPNDPIANARKLLTGTK